jgi:predicted  nucleic acid-binding Zn-ribbon protein
MNAFKTHCTIGLVAGALLLAALAPAAYAAPDRPLPADHRAAMRTGMAEGLEGAIQRARSRLNLNAEQSARLDAILDAAKAQAKAARDAARPAMAEMKAELAKAEPNLRRLAQLQDSLAPQREALRKAVREQLLSFYDTLDSAQKQTVLDGLRRMAEFRERIAERRSRP